MKQKRNPIEQAVLDLGGTVINLEKVGNDKIKLHVEHAKSL